jgi:hypothetical protein
MMRLIFIVVVVVLAVVAAIAVALHHFFGWKGLIAFPFILVALAWIGKKAIGYVVRRFALGLFSMKSRALRGATLTVHSITPVPKPAVLDESDEDDGDSEGVTEEEGAHQEDPDAPKEYFAIDLTITPRDGGGAVWEPGELMLASERISSLMDLEDEAKQVGHVEDVQVWNGKSFGPDDAGKYPGMQRLKLTFSVKPETSESWLHYYAEAIGPVELPRWQVRA